jgi:hypothetical protein
MATEKELLEKILAALQKGAPPPSKGRPDDPEKAAKYDKERAEAEEKRARRARDNIALAETQEERNKIKLDQHKQYIDQLKEELVDEEEGTAAYKKKVQAIKEGTKAYKDASAALQKHNQEMGYGAEKAKLLSNSVLGINGEFQKFMRFVPKSKAELKGFFKEMKNALKPTKLLGALLMKVISNSVNFALSVDKAGASFRAATGAGYEYQNVITNAGAAYLTYGINAKDAGEAAKGLFGSFRDFTTLSRKEKTRLVATTAILKKFGVSEQETGKNLNIMTKALGMNKTAAMGTLLEFEAIARTVGKPISEISKDFASAMPKLAFYGQQAVDVFKELEMQSKSTGLSIDDILGIFGDQFDTFEGSAKAVGKLNALMGGPYLNSIDMLNSSESERLELMQQGMEASNIYWEDLSKPERQAYANAMGTSVDKLGQALVKLTPLEEAQALRQDQLARKAGQARDVIQKLKDAFNSIIIKHQGLSDMIVKNVDKFADWIQSGHDLGDLWNDLFGKGGKFEPYIEQIKAFGKMIAWVYLTIQGFKIASFISSLNLIGTTAVANAGKVGMMGRGMSALGGMAMGGMMAYGASKMGSQLYASGREEAGQNVAKYGGMAGGALLGARAGMMFGPWGAAIGGVLGAGGGYLYGRQNARNMVTENTQADVDYNDGWEVYSTKGGKRKKIGGASVNNADSIAMLAGTPSGPLAQGTGLFGNAAAPTGDSGAALAEAIERGIAAGLAKASFETKVELAANTKGLLDLVDSPAGKHAYMPFYAGK